jgi:hypothetical protein
MSTTDLLAELAACAVRLVPSNDGLRLGIQPPDGLTPEMRQAIIEHKRALLDLLRCDRCGSTQCRDVPIHGGRSTRRDCLRCGRFMGWPHWYDATDGMAEATDNAPQNAPPTTKAA